MAVSGVLFVGGKDVSTDLVNQYKERSKDWSKSASFNFDTSKLPKGSAEKLGAELVKQATEKSSYTTGGAILGWLGDLVTGQGIQASPTQREEYSDVLIAYYKSKNVPLQPGQFSVLDGKGEEKELYFVGKFQDFLNSQGKDKPKESGFLPTSFLAGTPFDGKEAIFYVLLLIFILWLINRS